MNFDWHDIVICDKKYILGALFRAPKILGISYDKNDKGVFVMLMR